MTQEVGPVGLDMAPTTQRSRREPWVVRRDVYIGGWVVAALALVGVPLGLIWQAVSPRSAGLVLQSGAIIPDETEALIGTDGWFALLTGVVGLIAALVVWTRRPWRGPATVVALALGGVVGALVTALVGHLTGGGAVDRQGWRLAHAAGVAACDGPAVPRGCDCRTGLRPPGCLHHAGRPGSDGRPGASRTNRPTRRRRRRLGRHFASDQFATGLIQSARGSIGALRVC